MINSALIPCETAPRGARILVWMIRSASLLAIYLMIAIFHDPLPYPVRQIAGVLVSLLALASVGLLLVLWARPGCARPGLAPRVTITLGALMFAYAMFTVSNFELLPYPWGKLVVAPLFPLILGMVMWWTARNKDEVQRAAAFEGFSWGALVGVGLIFMSIFVVRYTPAVADGLQQVASRSNNHQPPAAVGFALGAFFSLMVVWMSMFISRGLWWRSRL